MAAAPCATAFRSYGMIRSARDAGEGHGPGTRTACRRAAVALEGATPGVGAAHRKCMPWPPVRVPTQCNGSYQLRTYVRTVEDRRSNVASVRSERPFDGGRRALSGDGHPGREERGSPPSLPRTVPSMGEMRDFPPRRAQAGAASSVVRLLLPTRSPLRAGRLPVRYRPSRYLNQDPLRAAGGSVG